MSAALSEAKNKMVAGIQMLAEGVIAYIKEMPEEFPAVGAGGADVGAGGDGIGDDISTCTFPEAGRLLGVSAGTVRRYCERGEIQCSVDPRTNWRRPYNRSIREFSERRRGVSQDGSKQQTLVG